MKKNLWALVALVATGLTAWNAQAQDAPARRPEQGAATEAQMANILPAQRFQFVPFEYNSTRDGLFPIDRFEYLRVRPGHLELFMAHLPSAIVEEYEWVSCEKKGEIWEVEIKDVQADDFSKLTINLAVQARTGLAVLRVRSNRSSAITSSAGGINPNNLVFKGYMYPY